MAKKLSEQMARCVLISGSNIYTINLNFWGVLTYNACPGCLRLADQSGGTHAILQGQRVC
jgi:hypothetical protein